MVASALFGGGTVDDWSEELVKIVRGVWSSGLTEGEITIISIAMIIVILKDLRLVIF